MNDDDYDDDDYDDEDFGEDDEVEIMVEPYEDVLAENGISPEAFEEALGQAIDDYHKQVEALGDEEEMPGIGEMPLTVNGRTFRLDELAEVFLSDESESDESE